MVLCGLESTLPVTLDMMITQGQEERAMTTHATSVIERRPVLSPWEDYKRSVDWSLDSKGPGAPQYGTYFEVDAADARAA